MKQQKSDHPVVVLKSGNADGAKGVTSICNLNSRRIKLTRFSESA